MSDESAPEKPFEFVELAGLVPLSEILRAVPYRILERG